MPEKALEMLAVHARDYGIELTEHQLDLFRIYLRELLRWNSRMNLTGVGSPERVAIELFLDSIVPSGRIPVQTALLDVGSGAGFPGLPLKIVNPNLQVHLLESRAKRVSFLRQVIRLLDLDNIWVIRGRVEREAGLPADCYPVVTARALAPFSQTLRWCSPLLCCGGMLVCYLGEQAPEELIVGREVMGEQGLTSQEVFPYALPGKKGLRHAVILRKAPSR